jgi:hypothetical protein
VAGLLKSCTLDAERGDVAREKLERAIGLELREITVQFMEAFRDRAEEMRLCFRVSRLSELRLRPAT